MNETAPFMATSLFGASERSSRRDCQAPGDTATTLTGTGHGTYLGEFRVRFDICSQFSGWKDGEAIFTAANGDALHIRYAARPLRLGQVTQVQISQQIPLVR